MTPNEFQKQYHDWVTLSETEAHKEADRVNQLLESTAQGFVKPVCFEGVWCLMLSRSMQFLQETGILEHDTKKVID